MKRLSLTLAALLLIAGSAQAQLVARKTLTLDGARQVIAAGMDFAKANSAPGGVIAVVDDGGNLMALECLDGTFAAGASISIGKARTAALFKKPTKFFEDVINKGRTAMAAMHENFTPLQGGLPISVDGHIVGAVGVSGASSAQQDEEIAMAGAAALTGTTAAPSKQSAVSAPGRAMIFHAKDVRESFLKDGHLVGEPGYKVNTSRRTAPGAAEVHDGETDVFYIVEGRTTLVVGGTVNEPRNESPGETRGKAIEGGESHQLKAGDVVIIPPGTPHQFTQIDAPLNYFVVKPVGPGAGTVARR